MKQAIFILFAILLSSCSSTFYYSTLNTTTYYVDKVENGDFLLETDSLWIAYCFKGYDAPMQITVFNKTNQPLYVDWKRSAMIMHNLAYSYAGEAVPFMGNSRTRGYTYNPDGTYSYSESSGIFDGNILMMSDRTTFIPPNSMISESPLGLHPDFHSLSKDIYKDGTVTTWSKKTQKVQTADFTFSDTPMKFKSYLTIYAVPDKPMVFEQDSYVSSAMKTGLSPNKLGYRFTERGDLFYIERPPNNAVLYGVLVGASLAGVIIWGVVEHDKMERKFEENKPF